MLARFMGQKQKSGLNSTLLFVTVAWFTWCGIKDRYCVSPDYRSCTKQTDGEKEALTVGMGASAACRVLDSLLAIQSPIPLFHHLASLLLAACMKRGRMGMLPILQGLVVGRRFGWCCLSSKVLPGKTSRGCAMSFLFLVGGSSAPSAVLCVDAAAM